MILCTMRLGLEKCLAWWWILFHQNLSCKYMVKTWFTPRRFTLNKILKLFLLHNDVLSSGGFKYNIEDSWWHVGKYFPEHIQKNVCLNPNNRDCNTQSQSSTYSSGLPNWVKNTASTTSTRRASKARAIKEISSWKLMGASIPLNQMILHPLSAALDWWCVVYYICKMRKRKKERTTSGTGAPAAAQKEDYSLLLIVLVYSLIQHFLTSLWSLWKLFKRKALLKMSLSFKKGNISLLAAMLCSGWLPKPFISTSNCACAKMQAALAMGWPYWCPATWLQAGSGTLDFRLSHRFTITFMCLDRKLCMNRQSF